MKRQQAWRLEDDDRASGREVLLAGAGAIVFGLAVYAFLIWLFTL
jgi:hypothetical protein